MENTTIYTWETLPDNLLAEAVRRIINDGLRLSKTLIKSYLRIFHIEVIENE